MTDAHHKLTRLRLSEAERTIAELRKLIDDIKDLSESDHKPALSAFFSTLPDDDYYTPLMPR